MSSIIEIVAEFLKDRRGLWILFLVFLVSLFLLFFSFNLNTKQKGQLPVFSLMESIKYTERLDLLSYQSNEVLLLGHPDVLQKMIDNAIEDSIKIHDEEMDMRLELERSRVEKESVLSKQTVFQNELAKMKEDDDNCRRNYEVLSGDFAKFLKDLENAPENSIQPLLGEAGDRLFKKYRVKAKSLKDEKLSERWVTDRELRDIKDSLNTIRIECKKKRLLLWENSSKQIRHYTKAMHYSVVTRTLNKLNDKISGYETKITDYEKSLDLSRMKISNLKTAIANASEESNLSKGKKKPRVLAILPTKTNLYINLKKIDAIICPDSTIKIYYDSIYIDPIDIFIDSSAHYNVAQNRVELEKEDNGLFFSVFEQFQTGIEVIRKKVQKKIYTEEYQKMALSKALKYFNSIYNPMGYKVELEMKSAMKKTTIASTSALVSLQKTEKKVPTIETINNQVGNKPIEITKDNDIEKGQPDKMSSGIDVSYWNGVINWELVKTQNVDFVYVKATQGIDYKDRLFDNHWSGVGKSKISRGAYHFYVPGDDPVSQADFFIKTIGNAEGMLVPMIDLEDTSLGEVSISQYQQNILKWLEIVEEHFKVKPIIYTYTYYAEKYLNDPKFAEYKLWIAQYSTEAQPHIPPLWQNKGWLIWQYSSHDKLKGINGYVDIDKMQ